jgi:hypothetical protein
VGLLEEAFELLLPAVIARVTLNQQLLPVLKRALCPRRLRRVLRKKKKEDAQFACFASTKV